MAKPLKFILAVVVLLWGIEVVDLVVRGTGSVGLDVWGVRPRTGDGLLGVLFAPFLHSGFGHLAGNTVPLVVLSGLALLAGSFGSYLRAVVYSGAGAGLGSWLFGASGSVHIGASGVVFGLAGYVVTKGIVTRHPLWVLLAVVVAVLYGGMVFGLFRWEAGISWTGHAFGLVGGVLAARSERRDGVGEIG